MLNIWRRNGKQNIANTTPKNILWDLSQFQSYCEKYLWSRPQFPEELLSINELSTEVLVIHIPRPMHQYGNHYFMIYDNA